MTLEKERMENIKFEEKNFYWYTYKNLIVYGGAVFSEKSIILAQPEEPGNKQRFLTL